jgi:CheY-like chemotaxis protein
VSKKRILIVEDDGDLRRMFRTALTMAGYEVEEAADGIDALHAIENRRPDLVVLDLMLQALDGLSVQQELAARAITSAIPIVIVTGSAMDISGANVTCVLRKPVTPDQLIETVQHCMLRGVSASTAYPHHL